MNTQILPNWCKKLGLLLFLFGALPSAFIGFNSGLNNLHTDYDAIYLIHPFFLRYMDIVEYLGILIYFLSKEKIEDDYINKLRLDSYQLTSIIGVGISFLIFLFFKDIKIHISVFFELFLIIFLITFYSKKRADL